jgi:lipid II:glycine glycyltransferase (peptidoglycan interpeptide bridge formation enzyme)
VRKAERAGLDVQVDHTGRLIPVFYHLYEQSVERWAHQAGEPLTLARMRARRANPQRKLQAVAARLGQACSTWVAWHAGQPAASIIVLRAGSQAKYWRGAMNHELASPTRANDLLHKLAIERACHDDCDYYHMGDSRPGSSLAGFKRGFGAEPMDSWSLLRERLPVTAAQRGLRTLVKRAIRYQDP